MSNNTFLRLLFFLIRRPTLILEKRGEGKKRREEKRERNVWCIVQGDLLGLQRLLLLT